MRQLKITKKITERTSETISLYFSEVNKLPLLTVKEEVELAERIAKGDKAALDKLVKSNLRFVISVAKNYQHQGLPIGDLINEGNLGLIRAAQKFDSSRGFKFISYAVWWIRQSILQALLEQSKIIRIPNNQNININKINKTFATLEQELEREPSDDEIQEALKDASINVREIRTINTMKPISLDSPIREGEDLSYIDLIPNENSDRPDGNFITESLQKDLDNVMKKLNPRQRRIICMYFGLLGYQSMTLEEIGDYFDLTRERVRQIKDSGIRLLKCRGNSTILRQYFGDNS